MKNNKLTDSEIVKALEDKIEFENFDENGYAVVDIEKLKNTLDLINRLQAENERLNKENQLMLDNHPANTHRNCVVIDNGVIYTKTIEDYEKFLTDVSTEAYKEFAERLKEKSWDVPYETKNAHFVQVVDVGDLDNLLKELVGDNK